MLYKNGSCLGCRVVVTSCRCFHRNIKVGDIATVVDVFMVPFFNEPCYLLSFDNDFRGNGDKFQYVAMSAISSVVLPYCVSKKKGVKK